MAVLEALASGLPVITVRGVGAAEELRGELAEGILQKPDDPEELREKIERLLNPKHWSTLSHDARKIAEGYTWDRYLDRVEEELGKVASSG